LFFIPTDFTTMRVSDIKSRLFNIVSIPKLKTNYPSGEKYLRLFFISTDFPIMRVSDIKSRLF